MPIGNADADEIKVPEDTLAAVSGKVGRGSSVLMIQPKKLAKRIGKDEYNEWVEAFGQEIRSQLIH